MRMIRTGMETFWAWPWKLKAPLMAVVAIILIGAFGGGGDGDPTQAGSDAEPTATVAPTEEPTQEPAVQSRCLEVPENLVLSIQEGLTVGATLANAYAVRSERFTEVYFIAADFEGGGLDGESGIWATSSLEGAGLILSIDAFARDFSNWPDGREIANPVTIEDDGAREAEACGG